MSSSHSPATDQACLEQRLRAFETCRVAVSGGVDSMTLALVAGRVTRARMFHAVSPAVPAEATARVREVAAREGWSLSVIEAGEFSDENYLGNPHERCFHCKTNLYQAIAAHPGGVILSGANVEDFDDFRPGLRAAENFATRHPLAECGLTKVRVRALCAALGYPEVADLPAAPCLSSRVETGLRIQPEVLRFVHRVEKELRRALQPEVVRCRVRHATIAIELDEASFAALDPAQSQAWQARVRQWAQDLALPDQVRVEPYRMGSAFVAP